MSELISKQQVCEVLAQFAPENYTKLVEMLVVKLPAVDAVVLPCNVGDEIYRIVKPSGACKPFIPTLPDKVEPFGICYRNVMGGYSLIPLDEFGKTVFLTREEAEAALERREENAAD